VFDRLERLFALLLAEREDDVVDVEEDDHESYRPMIIRAGEEKM
jgi:hypothetical protein